MTNMPSSVKQNLSSTKSPANPELDHLVPPMPTVARRLVLSVLVLAATVALAFLVISGRLYPRLQVDGLGTGFNVDDAVAVLQVDLSNGGQRDIEIRSVVISVDGVAQPGIDIHTIGDDGQFGASVRIENGALPFVLEANTRAMLTVAVVPAACGGSVDGSTVVGLDADTEIAYALTGFPAIERTARVADVFAGSTFTCGPLD